MDRREFLQNTCIAVGGGVVGAILGPFVQGYVESRYEDKHLISVRFHKFDRTGQPPEDFGLDTDIVPYEAFFIEIENTGDFPETNVKGGLTLWMDPLPWTRRITNDQVEQMTRFQWMEVYEAGGSASLGPSPPSVGDFRSRNIQFEIPRMVPGKMITIHFSSPVNIYSAFAKGESHDVEFKSSFNTGDPRFPDS